MDEQSSLEFVLDRILGRKLYERMKIEYFTLIGSGSLDRFLMNSDNTDTKEKSSSTEDTLFLFHAPLLSSQ